MTRHIGQHARDCRICTNVNLAYIEGVGKCDLCERSKFDCDVATDCTGRRERLNAEAS